MNIKINESFNRARVFFQRRKKIFFVVAAGSLAGAAFLCFGIGFVKADTDGPNSPSIAVNAASGEVAWTNPTNVFSTNNAYAIASLNTSSTSTDESRYILIGGFGFSIPSTATIDGITFDVERGSSAADCVKDKNIYIVKGGSLITVENKADTVNYWPMVDADKTYGGPADLWGTTWTPADINANNFGIAIKTNIPPESSVGSCFANIDYVRATIEYCFPPNLSTSNKTENDPDDTVVPGQAVTYTISLINTGGRASGLTFTDVIDSHYGNPFAFSTAGCGTPTASFSAPTGTVSNISIARHSTCTLSYNVRLDNPIIDPNPSAIAINNQAQVSPAWGSGTMVAGPLFVNVTPDLSTSTKSDDDPDSNVNAGQTVNYTLTIRNTGDGTGTGIDIDDAMDANLENLAVNSLTSCGASYVDNSTANPPVLNIDGVRADPGTNCVISFSARVKASTPVGTNIPNTATVSPASEGGSGATPSSPTLTVAGGSGGGSGGGTIFNIPDNYLVLINNGNEKTDKSDVKLYLESENATEVSISNDMYSVGNLWEDFSTPEVRDWTLEPGDGLRYVYVKYKSSDNYESPIIDDSINVDSSYVPPEDEVIAPPDVPVVTPPGGGAPAEETVIDCTVDCGLIDYQLYILNPDVTRRSTSGANVRIENVSPGITIYRFEDKTDMDFDDLVVRVEHTGCEEIIVEIIGMNANWHHAVGIKLLYNGVPKKDIRLWGDSHEAEGDRATILLDDHLDICLEELIPGDPSAPHVTVYQEVNYGGSSETFFANEGDFRETAIGNDTVSSIQVFNDAVVELFEHIYYDGMSIITGEDIADLGGTALGAKVLSSLRFIAP